MPRQARGVDLTAGRQNAQRDGQIEPLGVLLTVKSIKVIYFQ
jgi:hypothetical protein